MEHLKKFDSFVNEEESFVKNLLLSTLLSLGLNYSDAQSIKNDPLKVEVVENINSFNRSILENPDKSKLNFEKLKRDLSTKIDEPELFIERYLVFRDGSFVVRNNFLNGLEIHLNRNSFGVSYVHNF